MALWSAAYSELRPDVPGCAEPSMDQALRQAATEFFRRTRAWRVWLTPIEILAAERSYTIPRPTGALVVRLEQATVDGQPTGIHLFNAFDADPALAPDLVSAGVASPDRVTVTTLTQLAVGADLQLQASLTCSRAATSIPDELMEQHIDALVAGARGRLMKKAGKAYTNLELAAAALAEFEAAIGAQAYSTHTGDTGQVPRRRLRMC